MNLASAPGAALRADYSGGVHPVLGVADGIFLDPLTGLGNRALLDHTLANWRPVAPDAGGVALIMLDLDRFKRVNDTLGHGAGDALLRLAAKRLRRAARAGDVLVRFGGDEFIILHTLGAQPDGAEATARRVVELLGRPFLIDGQQAHVGASVGVAVLHHGTDSVQELLRHADLALYEAKTSGRGTVRFFHPDQARRASERRELELSLRRALVLKEFSLVYQPQVQMPGGELSGFEALIRWQRPGLGTIPPAAFIPLAEEIGEIHAIGAWVLRNACRAAAGWPAPLAVSVNVSPVQFEGERFVDTVREALSACGLAPQRLEIEITEGALLNNARPCWSGCGRCKKWASG